MEAPLRHITCRNFTLESADKLTNMFSSIQDMTYFAVFLQTIQGSNPAIRFCYLNTEGPLHRTSSLPMNYLVFPRLLSRLLIIFLITKTVTITSITGGWFPAEIVLLVIGRLIILGGASIGGFVGAHGGLPAALARAIAGLPPAARGPYSRGGGVGTAREGVLASVEASLFYQYFFSVYIFFYNILMNISIIYLFY